ncbi:helix-turn-helix domain-containing protein [Congregibacter sp.]|uniref:helix-turn-helix domain-containing protein n=1 Tax=Congregibacter sp. TaxID=2744308 RepID=UPI003F6CA4CB
MNRYLAGKNIQSMCDVLDLGLEQVLSRAEVAATKEPISGRVFTAAELARVYSSVIAEYKGDDVHIRVAKGFVGNPHGPHEISFLVSQNLGQALNRISHTFSWIEPVAWEVRQTPETLEISIKATHPDFPLSGFVEIADFIYLVETCRFHSGQNLCARRIQITSAVPHQDEIAKELGCIIEVGDYNLLVFDSSAADVPLTPNHPFLGAQIDKEIDFRASQISQSQSFIDAVIDSIKQNVMNDVSAASVAKSLSLSKRTLERRLAEHGTTFRKVLDKVRYELALEYLGYSNYTLAEVGYLTGFTQHNSFLRAFKRWRGETPGEYRKSLSREPRTLPV